MAVLLGLMCKSSCESSQLVLYAANDHHKVVNISKQAGILANTKSLVKYAESCFSGKQSAPVPAAIPANMFRDILLERRHVSHAKLSV